MRETLEQLTARANAGAFIPPPDPTGATKMATKVKLAKGKEFTFAKAAGGESKYPWDEWLNGDLLLLERSDVDAEGELVPGGTKRDFEVERDAMPGKLKTAARRRYKKVQISKRDADGNKIDNDGLIIRARDMTPDERADEDVLRAEEKEANAARRAARNGTDEPTAA